VELASRRYANVFDLPIEGPENVRGCDASNEAIGGCYGVGWNEYFQDANTGEQYVVNCSDGVNGGKGAYSDKDEGVRQEYYQALCVRFREEAASGALEIRISRNERFVMQGFTHAALLESGHDQLDGKQSKEGLEGGLVGHFHGIPVICDLEL